MCLHCHRCAGICLPRAGCHLVGKLIKRAVLMPCAMITCHAPNTQWVLAISALKAECGCMLCCVPVCVSHTYGWDTGLNHSGSPSTVAVCSTQLYHIVLCRRTTWAAMAATARGCQPVYLQQAFCTVFLLTATVVQGCAPPVVCTWPPCDKVIVRATA